MVGRFMIFSVVNLARLRILSVLATLSLLVTVGRLYLLLLRGKCQFPINTSNNLKDPAMAPCVLRMYLHVNKSRFVKFTLSLSILIKSVPFSGWWRWGWWWELGGGGPGEGGDIPNRP